MYFETLENLPDHIRIILPKNCQNLYKTKYNESFNDYRNDVLAHKVAWSLIEKIYPREYRRKNK